MPAIRHRRIHGHSPWNNSGRVDLRLEVPDWTRDALCTEIGVEVFFSDGNGDQATRLAKQACAACPVVSDCLEWALSFSQRDDEYGVFAGTGPIERRKLRAQRAQMGVAA
jgi:WhiB family redox-sensing transcriptional regulator